MKEPILSREEVKALYSKHIANPYDLLPRHVEAFVADYEAAVLERVCGKPIYQVWIEETSSYADVTAEYCAERLPSNRRIVYAINRSKS
ncbi:TPA: hypothetical protein U2L37_000111 [Burkholderia multivorans]|nr:hypothetical protein [Burkholderia multivorans]HEM7812338.1 hypothetical protein [Burkholderia multivorans]HEM7817963.1 hypothetical protein [Burkholderia multivorans]HEM7823887.1 hypothetical protein [Burkholderia multivorans]